jgi:RNA polymerase sigma-70 factor (ECF subfamily)
MNEHISRIRSGDEKVFSEIIDEYSPYLATVVRSVFVLNAHDVEDIIAETMMSLWRSAKKLRVDTNLKAYLATIARNKTIDHLRKKRAEMVELDVNLSDSANIESDYLRKEFSQFLASKINEVKEPDRSILLLKYYSGLKSKEIAEQLGMTPNKVDVRLSRQRSKLKKILLKMEAMA